MVTINDFVLLSELLGSLSWFNATNAKRQSDIIERLYELLREIEEDERELIFELTKKFTNITFAMLEGIVQELCLAMPKTLFDNANSIYVIPISAKKDAHKVKSGSSVSNFLKTSFEYDIPIDKTMTRVEHLVNVSFLERFSNRNNSLIILCDDFIGTGTQAVDCIKWYEEYKKNDDKIIFLTIAALENGIDKIRSKGFEIYYYMLHSKGISDDAHLRNINAKDIMLNMERRMKVPRNCQLGFEKSEALIAINFRAPNNTFPIYWCNTPKRLSTPAFGR